MRAALGPVRTSTRPLRSLVVLLLLALPACGAPPAEVDLVGRVESPSGAPMSGVLVHAGDTLTTAATDGSFEISGVRVPYTLTVASTVGDPWAHAFAGLTSAAPLVVPTQAEPTRLQATLGGDAWGGSEVPPGHRVSVCVEGRDDVAWGCGFADEGAVSYSVPVAWSGATTASVRVHALYMTVADDDRPTGYTGVRQVDATVVHGSTTNLDLSQVPLTGTGSTIPVTIDAGSGTVAFAAVAVRVSERLVQTVYRGAWPGGVVDLALPPEDVADAYQVTAWATFPSGLTTYVWEVADPGEGSDVVAPPAPQQLEPPPGATGVTSDTVFRAMGGDAAAREFFWAPAGATPGPRVRLTTPATTQSTVSLPDVGVVGLAFPAGAPYEWLVIDLLAPDYEAAIALRLAVNDLFGIGGVGQAAGGAVAQSVLRGFTLAP